MFRLFRKLFIKPLVILSVADITPTINKFNGKRFNKRNIENELSFLFSQNIELDHDNNYLDYEEDEIGMNCYVGTYSVEEEDFLFDFFFYVNQHNKIFLTEIVNNSTSEYTKN